MQHTFMAKNPSVLWFLLGLSLFTVFVTIFSEAVGSTGVSTSFLKTLGKTLCLCLVAIAMDVVWGYCGILSLGHFAFFGIGGYAIGMWLMYERTKNIVVGSLGKQHFATDALRKVEAAIGTQIFGVVGSSEFPLIWAVLAFAYIATFGCRYCTRDAGFGLWLVGISQPRYRRVPVDLDAGDDTRAFTISVPKRYWTTWQ
jgi:ABC-type branched-subunit amino acid transport system permease subunit